MDYTQFSGIIKEVGQVRCLLLTASGDSIIIAGDFLSISMWKLPVDENATHVRFTSPSPTLSLSWIRDGRTFVSLHANGQLFLHTLLEHGTPFQRALKAYDNATDKGVIAVHDDGQQFATCCSEHIVVWKVWHKEQLDTANRIVAFKGTSTTDSVQLGFLTSNVLVAAYKKKKLIRTFDIDAGDTMREFRIEHFPVTAALSISNSRILVVEYDRAALYDLVKERLLCTTSWDAGIRYPRPVLVSRQGQFLLAENGIVQLYSAEGAALGKLSKRRGLTLAMAATSTLSMLAVCTWDDDGSYVQFWNDSAQRSHKRPRSPSVELQAEGHPNKTRPLPCHPTTTRTGQTETSSVSSMPDISNVVQDVRCGEGVWAKHPLCRSCLQTGKGGEESATDLCRFRGFRARGPDGIHFVKIGNRASPPKLIFNACMPKQSLEHVQVIEWTAAQALLPIIEAEKRHVSSSNIHLKPHDISTRVICDRCSISIFARAWFCTQCGADICGSCWDTLSSQVRHGLKCGKKPSHVADDFIPISSMSLAELQNAEDKMRQCTRPRCLGRLLVTMTAAPKGIRIAQIFSPGPRLTAALSLWRRGEPFVVRGAMTMITPEQFMAMDSAHDHKISVECEETGTTETMTWATYFKRWVAAPAKSKTLKVKDYPISMNLKDSHPNLTHEFTQVLENLLGEYTCPNGPLNLMSCWPDGSNPPDMGPKLYSATTDLSNNGSTKCHVDRSSAVNVMLYAAGDGAFAEWHIFPGRAIESIYDQLLKAGKVKKCAPGSEAQFFLQQRHFLDPKSHDAIAKMCGHACWHIEQRPGDAVFIPPRCPHQVSNRAPCLKIAVDFVTPDDVPALQKIERDIRLANLSPGKKVPELDLTQLNHTLWFTWLCAQTKWSMTKGEASQ